MSEQRHQLAVVAAALSHDPRAVPGLAQTAGFDGVQFDAVSSTLDLTELSQTGRREFRHLLASNNVQLVALGADFGAKGLGPAADIDRIVSRFSQIAEAAKGAGAPLVCIELGALPQPAPTQKPKPRVTADQAGLIIIPEKPAAATPEESRPVPGPDPALVAQVDAALVEIGARADRVGVTVAFRSDLASFAALERALSVAGCPWFGVDLDPVSVLRDEWTLDEVMSRLGGLVRHVRGRDAVLGADRRTRPAVIGRGSIDWNGVTAALEDAGYRGWITIDPIELSDRVASATAGAAYLRSRL